MSKQTNVTMPLPEISYLEDDALDEYFDEDDIVNSFESVLQKLTDVFGIEISEIDQSNLVLAGIIGYTIRKELEE